MISSRADTWLRRTVILPARHTRDSVDALYTGLAVAAIISIIAAAAAVFRRIVSWVTRTPVDTFVILFAVLLVVMVTLFTTVHWLQLDAAGIRLGRRSGKPRFVRWEHVLRIRPATRREVILDGWIWPPLPPREATRSPTSLGHYRIDYIGGRFYFPPSDPEEFERAAEYWREVHAEKHRGADQPPA